MSLARRRTLDGARIAVTGASGGIGLALAEEFARRGAKLVLNARRAEALTALCSRLGGDGCDTAVAVGDIAEEATRHKLLDTANERFGGLDILVNNAGVGAFGRFAEAEPANLRRILEVDFFATVELTRAALPLLQASAKSGERRPAVVNIGSILGHRGIPYAAEYCAAKFAVRGFTESIRPEFAKLGIDVLLVSPGTTDTGFFDNVLAMQVKLPWRKREGGGTKPEVVARATADALERGKREIIPSFGGAAMVRLNRWCPGLIDWYLSRYG
ncbi:MAG: SDR family NAD(P)-dependent oxidoreductase [Planctomycetales bacterium]|nr:SDR family NAD(P)-dependent oxidoreductase [Planctomycetales bacterium]MBN8624561.1 SDR family NAD(P)-dependent oxidoreductase [Planctomycetota bacterium]